MNKKAKQLLAYLLISIPVTLGIVLYINGGKMTLRQGLVTVTGCFLAFGIISMIAYLQGKDSKRIN